MNLLACRAEPVAGSERVFGGGDLDDPALGRTAGKLQVGGGGQVERLARAF
jgi:hypothetical protein